MIGHQILLNANDSTSLVFPILKEKGRYKVSFDTEFTFNPEEMVGIIDQIVEDTKLAKGYVLEVEDCESQEIVYSYKMSEVEDSDIIPCRTRDQPKRCYNLLFTLIEPKEVDLTCAFANSDNNTQIVGNPMLIVFLLVALALILLAVILRRRKKKQRVADPNLITLGSFQFDKRNAELILQEQTIELTSKEADLLLLLYQSVNTTVERDVILNVVWGDEGDYIGRTLDVFISKLRKKLEADSSVKIVNTRGVGYRLVIA
ncbi:MAG: response regulator transcription factor [Fluviicola sp.]|nr:response regulator transcription factor [Fluviicola sp.]